MKFLQITAAVCISVIFSISCHAEEKETPSFESPWEKFDNITISKLWNSEDAIMLSTSSLSWPDGKQGLVTYFQSKSRVYRCVDLYDAEFKQVGADCYRLKK